MGAGRVIESFVLDLEVNRWVIMIVMQLLLLVLGMVLESTGIIMITAPIFVPIIIKLGFDPIWFGVLFIINMEIGFLSPPFGYNLFYLRGVAPKSVTMVDIYLSVIPFIILMLFAMALFMVFPGIITYLPDKIFYSVIVLSSRLLLDSLMSKANFSAACCKCSTQYVAGCWLRRF